MATLPHTINIISTFSVAALTATGAFSRFTHGRYTPAFYAYQTERAPDDESTRVVPYVDAVLAILTLVPKTSTVALLLGVLFQAFGIVLRLKKGRNPLPDIAVCAPAVVAFWTSYAGW